jgi:GT2 family glycosyltransferase
MHGVIEDVTEFENLESGLPTAGVFLFSKVVWQKVGGFKGGFKKENIDYDFHRRIRDLGLRVYCIRSVYILHAKGL